MRTVVVCLSLVALAGCGSDKSGSSLGSPAPVATKDLTIRELMQLLEKKGLKGCKWQQVWGNPTQAEILFDASSPNSKVSELSPDRSEPKTRMGDAVEFAEALDHAGRVGAHGVHGLDHCDQKEDGDDGNDDEEKDGKCGVHGVPFMLR